MNFPSWARFPRRFFLAGALAARLAAPAAAQSAAPAERLQPQVVLGTRTGADPETLGTVVDAIAASDLAREQIGSLQEALTGVPGAPAFATGRAGASDSLFLRGANSNQTLFLVDGIRLNDANTDYGPFLGGARICACDSLEIAHGPQSTLYGGEAVGGVVSLRALKGEGTPTAQVGAEAGSFGTVQGAVSAQGANGPWAYNFAAAGGRTDNDRANNDFDSGNLTLRLDRALAPGFAVGATVRGFAGRYGDPGDRFTNDPDNYEKENNWLGTVFAEAVPSPDFSSRLTLGGQDRRFLSVNPAPGQPTQVTLVKNRRAVLDWQNTMKLGPQNRLTAGLTTEAETTRNTGFGDIDKRQTLFAVFADDEWSPVERVYLTGGLRHDDFDTFGGATTGRATAAWLTPDRTLKLRTSYGTGFDSPSFLDLYGQSAFFVGNPKVRPERARGWDAGFDWYLPERRGSVSASWFHTDYRDLIVDDFTVFPGTTANVQNARTRGIELAARAALPGAVQAKLAYTYLEAENLSAQAPLLRRPRNSGSADLWHDFGHGVGIGAGAAFVGRRADVDARTFATVYDPSYTVVRLYASWQATSRLALKARIENLLDRKYEPVNGYPALGTGAFAGAEYKW